MKQKALDGIKCKYRGDFVHVVPATTEMVISQRLQKSEIPERVGATSLNLFESSGYVVGQFSSKPASVVQELMPSEKSYA